MGRKPRIIFPGKTVESLVGRPKKYLINSALVMTQDTNRLPIVDRMRITGKDPESKAGLDNSGVKLENLTTY